MRQKGKGRSIYCGYSLAHQPLSTAVVPFLAIIPFSHHKLSVNTAKSVTQPCSIQLYFDAFHLLKLSNLTFKNILIICSRFDFSGISNVRIKLLSKYSISRMYKNPNILLMWRTYFIFFLNPFPASLVIKHIQNILNSFHITTRFWEDDIFSVSVTKYIKKLMFGWHYWQPC